MVQTFIPTSRWGSVPPTCLCSVAQSDRWLPCFSALGMGVFALTLEPASRKLANTAANLLAIMILIGGSYHAVYTCLGFGSKLTDPTLREAILAHVIDLRATISYPMYATGLTATALIYRLALTKRTFFPRWLLLFLPTTLLLIIDPRNSSAATNAAII